MNATILHLQYECGAVCPSDNNIFSNWSEYWYQLQYQTKNITHKHTIHISNHFTEDRSLQG